MWNFASYVRILESLETAISFNERKKATIKIYRNVGTLAAEAEPILQY